MSAWRYWLKNTTCCASPSKCSSGALEGVAMLQVCGELPQQTTCSYKLLLGSATMQHRRCTHGSECHSRCRGYGTPWRTVRTRFRKALWKRSREMTQGPQQNLAEFPLELAVRTMIRAQASTVAPDVCRPANGKMPASMALRTTQELLSCADG